MFLTTDRKKYIDIVIKSVLLNLNNTEYQYVLDKYYELVDYIFFKLLIDDKDSDKFFEQLKRNKNREIISILYLFFPYINDSNNYEKFKLIKTLSDITLKKIKKLMKYLIFNIVEVIKKILYIKNMHFQLKILMLILNY